MATPGKIRRDFRIFQRDKFHCVYCGYTGNTFETWRYLTIDHLNPRASGGTEDDGNLVTACMDCNTIKKDYQFATLEAAKAQLAAWLAKERKDFDEHFAPSLGYSKTAVQWPYTSFVSLADEFLIAYACAPVAGIGHALFNIGHAVELYLKAILLKANPKTDASKSGHNIEKLLAKVQAMHPLLSGYMLRKSAADKWLHNPVMPNAPDSDYDHYRHHMELYWISRYLADTKYLFASHKTIKGGFAIIYCSLNEYWQPFFREIRQHLGIPNPQSGPDVLADAVANAEIPEYARAYLRKIVYS